MITKAPIATDSSVRYEDFPSAIVAKDLDDGRHALWPDDADVQHIIITVSAKADQPVAALVLLDRHTPIRLDAVRRLWRRLTGHPGGAPVIPITAQQRRRFILMLRALDGWREHASYRDLAATLLDADVRDQSRRDWLTSSSRAQIIRIVRDGIRRMEGGYRDLLFGR